MSVTEPLLPQSGSSRRSGARAAPQQWEWDPYRARFVWPVKATNSAGEDVTVRFSMEEILRTISDETEDSKNVPGIEVPCRNEYGVHATYHMAIDEFLYICLALESSTLAR